MWQLVIALVVATTVHGGTHQTTRRYALEYPTRHTCQTADDRFDLEEAVRLANQLLSHSRKKNSRVVRADTSCEFGGLRADWRTR